ncbi:MAG: hypothetical protein ACK5MT_08410 [Actinomycetales bacterium]
MGQRSHRAVLWQWPLLTSALLGLVLTGVAFGVADVPGLTGSAIGTLSVIAFFGATAVVMSVTARLAPVSVMAVALASYAVKVMLFGLVLVLLFEAQWLSGMALAVAVVIVSAGWLAAQQFALRRARLPVYDE